MRSFQYPTQPFNGTYNDGTIDRLIIDTSKTYLYSPDGLKWAQLADSSWRYNDGNGWRMVANSTEFSFKSPNLTNELIVSDDDVRLKYGTSKLLLSGSGLFHDGQRVQTAAHKGAANGIVPLDGSSLISETYLPSYIDDVLDKFLDVGDTQGNGYDAFYDEAELINKTAEEAGKIYIDITAGGSTSYRWSGSVYTQLSSGLVLGDTASTAYRGDRGLTAYNHSQLTAEHIDWTDATANLSTEGWVSATGGGETGRFLTGLAGSTVFSFTGGSFDIRAGNGSSSSQNVLSITPTTLIHNDGTRDRLEVTADHIKLLSPNAVQLITIDDMEIKLQSGDDFLQLANSAFVHHDGLVNRQVIDTVKNHFIGPLGIHNLQITALGAYYDNVEIATVDDLNSDWDTAFGWGDHAGTYSLLGHTHAGGGSDRLISPDTLKSVIVSDTNFIYNDGESDRISILSNVSYIKAPSGINSMKVADSWSAISIAGQDRLNLTATTSELTSPDGALKVSVDDDGIALLGGTTIQSDGEALTLKATTVGQKAIHAYRKSDGTRMGWVGFGSSGDYRMGMFNDNVNQNIEITCTGTGQIRLNAPVKAESYIASDGQVGVSGVFVHNAQTWMTIKNGLVVGIG